MSDEISDAGRKDKFEQWEKFGLDQVKHDLLNGGFRVVGGPPQVRALAWEWVRMKEAEQKTQPEMSAGEILRALGLEKSSTGNLLGAQETDLDRLVKAAAGSTEPATAPSPKATSAEKRADVFTFKPNFHGIGLDLNELARRFQRWRKRRKP
jgi:hypothetical protein